MRKVGLVAAGVVVTLAIAGVALRTQAQKQDVSGEAQVVTAQAQVVTLSVPEMDCSGCEVGIKIAAGKINGVQSVKTDLETRTAEVSFDASKTNAEAIASALTKGTGFTIELPKRVKTT